MNIYIITYQTKVGPVTVRILAKDMQDAENYARQVSDDKFTIEVKE